MITPKYSRPFPKPLIYAADEAKMVSERVHSRILEPARFQEVTKSLFNSQVDLVHFVCHSVDNEAPCIQALYLEDYPFDSNKMAGLHIENPDKAFVF